MNSEFCGKCGATNAGQTAFCMQCGANLVKNEPQPNFSGQTPWSAPSPPPSNYMPQTPFQTLPANNFSPPNAGFQQPFQQSSSFQQTPLASTAASQKTGIGSKILSALGVLLVGAILFLKFGFVLLRAGRLGGIGLVAIIFLVIVAIGVFSLIRRK